MNRLTRERIEEIRDIFELGFGVDDDDVLSLCSMALEAVDGGWIPLSSMTPEHGQDILYVVEGSSHEEPFVVRGMRCHDGTDWFWCDDEGEMDEIGNDGENSYVRLWMSVPTPPASSLEPDLGSK